MAGRGGVGGVDLVGIVPTPVEFPDLVVGHVRHQLEELGVLPEEVLPDVGAVLGLEVLVLAVDALLHALEEQAGGVPGDEPVPPRSPDDLDDVPARPPEDRLQLLDDLPVAPHRPVEALQVAVHHEDQIVEPLPARQRDGAERLRLVRLPVTEERPHPAVGGVGQAPAAEVLEEPGLVDGHQRPQAHRHRGELPERRHQPRMRVRRQASAAHLLTEPVQLLPAQPPLEEGPGVEPRRRMPLEIDQVTAVRLCRGVPEVHLADVVERRRRLEAGDVPPELGGLLVGPQHHGQRVPPDQRPDPMLDGPVAGMAVLPLRRDRVQIRRVRRIRHRRPPPAPLTDQLAQQEMGPLGPFELQHGVEGLDPLPRLDGIRVHQHVASCRASGRPGRRRHATTSRTGRLKASEFLTTASILF